jgi:hypothetical protein
MREHRSHLIALLEIYASARDRNGRPTFRARSPAGSLTTLEGLLAHFQESGELRAFDTRSMALAIQAAIDIVPQRLAQNPAFDLDRYGEGISDILEGATRSHATGAPSGRAG